MPRIHLQLAIVLLCLGCGLAGAEGEAPASSPPVSDRLPGAEAHADALQQELARAVVARGDGYRPRTRHLRDDGSARFTNRLILESSPYLLQHAHNPVNWYPWGDAAFEEARRTGRPVLLSIGYSTCHWCHVMEEESFEDLEIAAYLNEHYIAVKVDREERPDVDAIYMSAVQALTGRGGWPMTTWLTPDRQPFYGGTYFPARDGDRGSRVGFLTLLKQLNSFYDLNPDEIAQRAEEVTRAVRSSMERLAPGESLPTLASVDRAVARYASSYDSRYGGIGRAPKFPSSLPIPLLLRHHWRTGDAKSLEMAERTLQQMARGGMYDQIGGGFHRYSTDARWLVPHFEKMLYDNALLATAYLEAFQLTGDPLYRRVVVEILEYIGREMTGPEGGFYSATDADSLDPEGHREEGRFFTWTPEEVRALLGGADAGLVLQRFGVTPEGNFEGRSILHVATDSETIAARANLPEAQVSRRLAAASARMYEARQLRPAPLRDEKILTSWNGLMISAMARAGFVLDRPDFTARARRAAEFVLERMVVDGRLRRAYKDGQARHRAYLDDHAFLVAGLIDLFEAEQELAWLERAMALQAQLDARFADDVGGYYMTASDAETLLAREKPGRDGAEPSGNSVALMNLLRLHELTGDDAYRASADRLLRAFAPALEERPRALSEMLLALEYRRAPREVVIAAAAGEDGADAFLDVVRSTFQPHKVVVVVGADGPNEGIGKRIPLTKGKVARDGRTTAYVCERGVCQLPTGDLERFRQQLEATTKPETEKAPS